MVAEDALGVHPCRPAQHAERVRAAVHEIAGEPDPVRRGVWSEHAEQRIESLAAPLDVTDDPGRRRLARRSRQLSSLARKTPRDLAG